MIVGAGPAPQPTACEGIHLPRPLRDFYAVHAGFRDGMWELHNPDNVRLWSEMFNHTGLQPVRCHDDDEMYYSSDLLYFFSYGDDRSDLFDIDNDPDDPPVRAWGEGGLYGHYGEPEKFW